MDYPTMSSASEKSIATSHLWVRINALSDDDLRIVLGWACDELARRRGWLEPLQGGDRNAAGSVSERVAFGRHKPLGRDRPA